MRLTEKEKEIKFKAFVEFREWLEFNFGMSAVNQLDKDFKLDGAIQNHRKEAI